MTILCLKMCVELSMKELVYAAHYSLLQGPTLGALCKALALTSNFLPKASLPLGLCYILGESANLFIARVGHHYREGETPPPSYEDKKNGDTHLLHWPQSCVGEHVGMMHCMISHMEFIQKIFSCCF